MLLDKPNLIINRNSYLKPSNFLQIINTLMELIQLYKLNNTEVFRGIFKNIFSLFFYGFNNNNNKFFGEVSKVLGFYMEIKNKTMGNELVVKIIANKFYSFLMTRIFKFL